MNSTVDLYESVLNDRLACILKPALMATQNVPLVIGSRCSTDGCVPEADAGEWLLWSAIFLQPQRRNSADRPSFFGRVGWNAWLEATVDTALMFSSATDKWPTPRWIYEALDKEFGFTLDPRSDGKNAKCERFFTMKDSPLLKSWGTETVFINLPYSACKEWMRKAYGAAQDGATVVCLVPSRTDTEWWHRYAMKGEIRFLRGRLKFGDHENSAPFPSALVIFRPREFRLVDSNA